MSTVERIGMSLYEFVHRQDDAPFEIIEGEIVEVTPSVFGSGEVTRLIHEALVTYGVAAHEFRVYADTTFVLPDSAANKGWVKGSRIPDVMVYALGRLETYKAANADWRINPLMLVPDLVVEVISPTDSLPKVWRKATIYLEDGVHLIWVVNPMRETVTIFAGNEPPITLDKSGVLSGGDVLPGFSLDVKTLFED